MLGRLSPYRQAQQLTLVLLLPLFCSGCYWWKYGKLMRTHVDLLTSMAKKMHDVLEDHRPLTPAMMEEFLYPLKRARDFVRIVRPRYAERHSLRAFTDFLDTYAALVKEADRARILNDTSVDFPKRVRALQEQGERVKAILAEEEQQA